MKSVLVSILSIVFVTCLTGCGSDSNSDGSGDGAAIIFDSTGAYDLKEYFYPSASATLYYDEWSQDFNNSIQKESWQSKYIITVTPNVVSTEDYYIGNSTEADTIGDTKITSVDAYGNAVEIARFVNIGDLISSNTYDEIQEIDGLTYREKFTGTCILKEHFGSKTFNPDDNSKYTYIDVLKVTCVYEYLYIETYNGETDNYTEYDSLDTYYAYSKGEVAEIDEDCLDEDDNIQDNRTICADTEKWHSYLNLIDSQFQ